MRIKGTCDFKAFWVISTKRVTITDATNETKSICENDQAKNGRTLSKKTMPQTSRTHTKRDASIQTANDKKK